MPKSRTLALARQSDAVALFREGQTFDQIAGAVGFANRGTAHRVVTKAFRERLVENIDMHRQLELDRLDDLQATLWPLMESGDVKAAALILEVIGQRSKLLGLLDHRPAPRVLVNDSAVEESDEGNPGKATPVLQLVQKQEKAA